MTTLTLDAPAPAGDGATRAHAPAQGTVVIEAPVRPARERTRAGDAPQPRRRPAPALGASTAETAQPFGRYQATTSQRRRKAATRLWVPQALTYAAVVCTAVALVLYFA